MRNDVKLQELKTLAIYLRLGRPLEVMEDIVELLEDVTLRIKSNKSEDNSPIAVIVASILECQEAEDWLGLADYIEYELPCYLESILLDKATII